jgi:transcriptional regulator with XRE-family HTH domain
LSTQIRSRRLERDLTQIQLSDLVGIGQPALVNWEHGRYKPRNAAVRKRLEAVLGAPLHVLLESESDDTLESAAASGLEVSTQKDRYGTS